MTAFQRYRREVAQKAIIIPMVIATVITILFSAALPFIENALPNAQRDAQSQVQEVENEQ
ncbi:MAG: hypothetical protein J5964_06785 [Eubacterium sp.]|nr:hypothetical protein [Eubacterium sp.]